MTIKIGVLMDPIESINPKKDSTLAMLLAAQNRHWDIYYMTPQDLYLSDGVAFANTCELFVKDDLDHWFEFKTASKMQALNELDCILMRVDPPYNMEYIYTTFILERAAEEGVLIVNKPSSLRNINEKLYISWFADYCVPTLVTASENQIHTFLTKHQDIIVKPLDGMGGQSIFRVKIDDPNKNVILETITHNSTVTIMAQRYIPEIIDGDKRILLVDGEPVPYALARIPAAGENRGNLAVGGSGVGKPLSKRDYEICRQVGPTLKEKGVLFAGLDVIGDYLTEINVTSPTCIRELDAIYKLNIADQLLDKIESYLKNN